MAPGSLLICTDLDRTLIPNGPQPESPGARAMLGRLVADPDVGLVFVSGRDQGLVEEAIREFDLPVPDFVIGDVGTTLYRVGPDHLWRPDTSWTEAIEGDWGGRTAADVAEMLGEMDGLELQPDERQNRHKLSYFSDPEFQGDAVTQRIVDRLKGHGLRARAIRSVDEGADGRPARGLLDVLPASASKYHAIRALMERQGHGLDNTVFCGDSGNDLEVLASPVRAVLVANASDSVRELAIRLSAEIGCSEALYLARGGFAGMNGNYAAGMLEGIVHYFPAVLEELADDTEGAA